MPPFSDPFDHDQTRLTTATQMIEAEYNNIDRALEEGVVTRRELRFNHFDGRRIEAPDIELPDLVDREGRPLTAYQVDVLKAAIAAELQAAVRFRRQTNRDDLTEQQALFIANTVRSTFAMPKITDIAAQTRTAADVRAELARLKAAQAPANSTITVKMPCGGVHPKTGEQLYHPDQVDVTRFGGQQILITDFTAYLERKGVCRKCRHDREILELLAWELEDSATYATLSFKRAVIDPDNPRKEEELLLFAGQLRQAIVLACRGATEIAGMPEYQAFEDRALACTDPGAWMAARDAMTRNGRAMLIERPLYQMQRAVEQYELDNGLAESERLKVFV
jgi:hypothetical protein